MIYKCLLNTAFFFFFYFCPSGVLNAECGLRAQNNETIPHNSPHVYPFSNSRRRIYLYSFPSLYYDYTIMYITFAIEYHKLFLLLRSIDVAV